MVTMIRRVDIYMSRLEEPHYVGRPIYIWVTKDNEELFHTYDSVSSHGYLVCKIENGIKS